MAEMIIRDIDSALAVTLDVMARERGLAVEALALELLRAAAHVRPTGRAAGAKAILASQETKAAVASLDLIREDRNR